MGEALGPGPGLDPDRGTPSGSRDGGAAREAQRRMGERLRAARQEQRLSLRHLAQRLGVSASLISQIETGIGFDDFVLGAGRRHLARLDVAASLEQQRLGAGPGGLVRVRADADRDGAEV